MLEIDPIKIEACWPPMVEQSHALGRDFAFATMQDVTSRLKLKSGKLSFSTYLRTEGICSMSFLVRWPKPCLAATGRLSTSVQSAPERTPRAPQLKKGI